jgi:hypothetical protein
MAQDSAEAPDSAAWRNGITARRATSGYIALAQGRYQDALRDLWRADTTFDGPDGNCVICVLDDIGLAWYRAGVADSAIYYWERYLGTPMFGRQGIDAMWRPMIVKQLAEAYEAKGDVPNAARRYREFISLWERADPKLQEQVADAKFKLRRLADTEGK